MFGELRFVASDDIGQLGPKEGKPVLYNWKWYYNISSLVLWVILFFAFVLVKENRNTKALLIIIPLLILSLLWSIFKKATGTEIFNPIFYSFVIGICLLWLTGHKVGNRNRFTAFLLALMVMIITGIVGMVSATGFKFTNDTMGFVIFYMVSTLSMLISITLAGVGCRKRFSSARLTLLLGLWSIAVSIAGLLGFYLIFLSLSGYSASTGTILFQITAAAMMIGAILYVIMLPFMILALKSDFFRQRLYAYLQLKSMVEERPQQEKS